MSAERLTVNKKKCTDCVFGQVKPVSTDKFPVYSLLSGILLVTPNLTRDCLTFSEKITDSVAKMIEKNTGLIFFEDRVERIVPFYAKCVKPEKFLRKTIK